MFFLILLCSAIGLPLVVSIPIDNGPIGDAEIQCNSHSIQLSWNTRNPWEGNLYVQNFFKDERCRTAGNAQRPQANIELQFDQCGVVRERSLNPRGVFVSTTVILSFHPHFVTKVDRAVKISCFYMEADKTVSQDILVSELQSTELQTAIVNMPVCRYDILDNGGPTGQPIRFALVGQPVTHKWTCDTETTDTFCMQIYDCFVDDGSGDKVQLLNADGCALDRNILDNIEYVSDLMAAKESHVFKYADRSSLYFNCQVRLTIKEPALNNATTTCPRPQCPPAPRGKRSALDTINRQTQPGQAVALRDGDTGTVGIQDVSVPHSLLVGDVDLEEKDIPAHLLHPSSVFEPPASSGNFLDSHPISEEDNMSHRDKLCLSPVGFSILIAVGGVFVVLTLALATMLCLRKPSKQSKYIYPS